MAKRKKKRRSLFASLADGLLSLIDFICETFSAAVIALLAGVGRALAGLLRGLARGLLALLRAVCGVPVWAFRRLIPVRELYAVSLTRDLT